MRYNFKLLFYDELPTYAMNLISYKDMCESSNVSESTNEKSGIYPK